MNKENLEKIFSEDLGTSFFPQLAEEYIKEGDYELARKVCNVGLLLNPQNNDGKYVLAKIMMVDGDGKGAEGILKKILSDDEFASEILKASKKPKKPIKRKKVVKQVTAKKSKASKRKSTLKSPRPIALKPENNKIDIDPKMATLTFVDILIKQKQFEQAGNVLKLVARNKSIARTSIKQRDVKIKRELAKEK